MERRNFLRGAATAGLLSVVTDPLALAREKADGNSKAQVLKKHPFRMKYAPHFGMFRNHAGEDLLDQLQFIADVGFTALEDNGMKSRTPEMQEKIAAKMASLGLEMGVFVAHTIYWDKPSLTSGDHAYREQFLKEIRESVDVARRVNAVWMTVVPGFVDLHLDEGYQRANVVESLRRACDIIEPHGLVMVLEPLNFRDHPGLYLNKISQSYEVCRAVNSPSCKILDDLYHMQVQEGNLIPNIDLAWDEIAYFQLGDNPGRQEPTTGEINYKNIFKHIHGKGFTGILGMEHGVSAPGKEGELALIQAYVEVDGFR